MLRWLRGEASQLALGITLASTIGLVIIITFALLQSQQPPVYTIIPTRTGQPEHCLTCHNGIEPISDSHSLGEFGCVSCHGGDGAAVDETGAHAGLVLNPASLDHVEQFCGDCHASQIALTERSIMTTYAGAITLIRHAFGLQNNDQAHYAVHAIGDLEAFAVTDSDPLPVQNFAANCQTCHVTAEAQQADYFYRSTGCATCHVLYGEDGHYQGSDPTVSKTEPGHSLTHQFTTSIPYTQCNHCHNRGNYDLRTMTFVPRDDLPAETTSEIDKRVHDYYQPISQFTRCEWELDCIDCHTSNEIMGDGVLYNNRSEAQYVQCKTCHGTLDAPPQSQLVESDEELAMTRANLNELVSLAVGDTILVTERGEPLYHVRQSGDQWILTGKATGQTYSVPLVQGSTCQQDPNNQSSSSCHECHTYDRESP